MRLVALQSLRPICLTYVRMRSQLPEACGNGMSLDVQALSSNCRLNIIFVLVEKIILACSKREVSRGRVHFTFITLQELLMLVGGIVQCVPKYMHEFHACRDHAMCNIQNRTIPVV
jgi:hypothetical protein